MKQYERINLMITVASRGYHDKIIKGLREIGVTYNMATVGESMAGPSVSNYLGLQDDETDIIFSVVSDSKSDRALAYIEYCDYLDAPESERAVAVFIPVGGVSGPLVLEYISGPNNGKQEMVKMTDQKETTYSMIFTIVSKGFADVAVAAAREAGAKGGAMFYARGSGVHETEKFLNISIEPEKEIVMTLVSSAEIRKVITAITDKAGLTTAAAGISFTLPVTRTAGIESGILTETSIAEATNTEETSN